MLNAVELRRAVDAKLDAGPRISLICQDLATRTYPITGSMLVRMIGWCIPQPTSFLGSANKNEAIVAVVPAVQNTDRATG